MLNTTTLPPEEDAFLEVRNAIAKLSANELHRVAVELDKYIHQQHVSKAPPGTLITSKAVREQCTVFLCEALSQFATNGITE